MHLYGRWNSIISVCNDFYLDFARIYDESDSVDGDGRFGDVGGDDALADVLRGIVEHLVLVGQREGAVQCKNYPFLNNKNKKNCLEAFEIDRQLTFCFTFSFTQDKNLWDTGSFAKVRLG